MQNKTVVFHPKALEEDEAARDWYSGRSIAASRAFVSEVIHSIDKIVKTPETWPSYEKGTRRFLK